MPVCVTLPLPATTTPLVPPSFEVKSSGDDQPAGAVLQEKGLFVVRRSTDAQRADNDRAVLDHEVAG